jgi:hypothetical protein
MLCYYLAGSLGLTYGVCASMGYLTISGVHLVTCGVVTCADRMSDMIHIPDIKMTLNSGSSEFDQVIYKVNATQEMVHGARVTGYVSRILSYYMAVILSLQIITLYGEKN